MPLKGKSGMCLAITRLLLDHYSCIVQEFSKKYEGYTSNTRVMHEHLCSLHSYISRMRTKRSFIVIVLWMKLLY